MNKVIKHYLNGSTNYGGANGYISNFTKDLPPADQAEYCTVNNLCKSDFIVFHRSDGLKFRVSKILRSLIFREPRAKFIQTFHNPVLPYLEQFYNNHSIKKIFMLPVLQFKFYLSLLVSDAFYFASPNSIASYKDPIFSMVTKAKRSGYFCTRIASESVPVEASARSEVKEKLTFGYLGREMRVKGADIFEDIAIKNSNFEFLATWDVRKSKVNEVKRIGKQNKWEFLSSIDALVVPNRHCYYDLVILEALSIGCKVIASNVGGTVDIQHPLLTKIDFHKFLTVDIKELHGRLITRNKDNTIVMEPASQIRHAFSEFLTRLVKDA